MLHLLFCFIFEVDVSVTSGLQFRTNRDSSGLVIYCVPSTKKEPSVMNNSALKETRFWESRLKMVGEITAAHICRVNKARSGTDVPPCSFQKLKFLLGPVINFAQNFYYDDDAFLKFFSVIWVYLV